MRSRKLALLLFDLTVICRLAALFPVAWLLPERSWTGFAHSAASVPGLDRSRKLARIRGTFGDLDSNSVNRIARENSANWILRQLQLFRSYRPGGWHPFVSIEGRERIDGALREGRGVILWNADFRFSDLVAKIGTHNAGYAVTFFTMPEHGWSASRFGIRYLNPIWVRIEKRYLAGRVVIDPSDPKPATDRIRHLLATNHIVAITAIRGAARRPVTVRVCGAQFRLGLGAPILAYETRATLLPVFTLRQPDGSFRMNVEEPLRIRADRPRIDAALEAVQEYGRRLEPYVRATPGQWNWWNMEGLGGELAHDGRTQESQASAPPPEQHVGR
jgi:lauroyl/myristoyl acyltransferase